MSEDVEKQLVKQLKVLNFWVRLFGIITVVMLLVVGLIMLRVALFIKDTNDTISEFQRTTSESLDIKTQLCDGEEGLSGFVKSTTGVCE